jgi:hypothetical protein
MSLVNYSNLDFDQIRNNIKDYLRSNSNFTDYDFEGSNLSTIIDVLAYNTYITSFNANMIANEVFIDSASLRENVVSLARNIGYVPRSKTASRSVVSFLVDLTTSREKYPITLTLKKGPVCTSSSSINGQTYVFLIPDDITVPVVDGVAFFEEITIYEGTLIETSFNVRSIDLTQRFILDNAGIDTNTINVFVRDNINSNSGNKFQIVNNLFNLDKRSNIAFLQEVEDERYELLFGDGIFGKKLENNNVIEVSYIVTSGNNANGISNFTYIGRIFDNDETLINTGISLISVLSPSDFGENIESVSFIKKYAPRVYSSQNRAVTPSDYESLIPRIYPEADLVTAYGGEELDPPQYGRVFLAIKPKFSQFVPDTIKLNLKRELKKYSVAGIIPEIVDMKLLYVEFISNVYYNRNRSLSSNVIKNEVFNSVISYSRSSELNRYGARFKYSKFQRIIDDSNEAITSNITTIQIRRDLAPILNSTATYEICFGNEFQIIESSGFNIKSSGFEIDGVTGICYFADIPFEDNTSIGEIVIFRLRSDLFADVILRDVGIVDYVKGEINLNPINIISTQKFSGSMPIIEISAIPKSNDVISLQDLYLILDINKSQINMVQDNIESGADISGTTYIRSSSYFTGNLIR